MQLAKSTTNNNYFIDQYLLVYLENNKIVSRVYDSAEEAFCEYEGLEEDSKKSDSTISKIHLYFL